MRKLEEECAKCEAELKKCGILPALPLSYEVIEDTKLWGRVSNIQGTYVIGIEELLLREDIPIEYLYDAILHEIIKSSKGCHMEHGSEWSKKANEFSYSNTPFSKYLVRSSLSNLGAPQPPEYPGLRTRKILMNKGDYIEHTIYGKGLCLERRNLGMDTILKIAWAKDKRISEHMESASEGMVTRQGRWAVL